MLYPEGATNVCPRKGDETVNWALISLDLYEKYILEKGLKFTPTPFRKYAILLCGKKFSSNIDVSYFFHKKPYYGKFSPKLFDPKSSWKPPEGRLPQNIKSDLAKLDVLLDVFHAT